MKKIIALMLALATVLGMVGCGNSAKEQESTAQESTAQEPTVQESTAQEPTDEELRQAVEYIKEAEENIVSAAAEQLDGWTTYSSIMNYYFDDTDYMNAKESSIQSRANRIHNYRTAARKAMEQAKNLLGNSGSGDYYNAVKEYYKAVNKFLTLISTFPEGYSQLTFSSTVSDYKSDCQSAYEEVLFYD